MFMLLLLSPAAFAELQTEVSDIASDLSDVGAPFCDFTTYTFKMLFPAQNDLQYRLCQLSHNVRECHRIQATARTGITWTGGTDSDQPWS